MANTKTQKSSLDAFFKKYKTEVSFASDLPNVERLSTGSLSLDFTLNGGLPKGKVAEFYGPSGGGKSTLALSVIAAQQEQWKKDDLDYYAMYLDLERSANTEYFEAVGVDTDRLLTVTPKSGEQAIDMVRDAVETGDIKLFVLDSLAAMVSAKEIDASAGDSVPAATARINTHFLRTVVPELDEAGATMIVINQLRENFSAMAFGPKTKTSGGKATEYFASMRIEIARIGQIKSGQEVIGNRIKMTVKKSRFSKPGRSVEADIIFGLGISRSGELIDLGLQLGILKKKGAFIYYEDDQIGQGKESARRALQRNKELSSRIENDIRAKTEELNQVKYNEDDIDEDTGVNVDTDDAPDFAAEG